MVKVYRKSEDFLSTANRRPQIKLKVDTSTPVHEKALKGQAMSHGTTLGVPQAVKKRRRYTTRSLDGKDFPIAIYQFKYRSKKSLQSLLILERTPEPSPFPSHYPIPSGASGSFDLDNLDATQKAKLQEFLENLMGTSTQPNEERKIKREREESGSRLKASKRSRRGGRVEIDLTGDDSN
ncbi:cb0b002f-385d-45ab-a81f-dbceabd4699c [Sclerotinia trifoliorum]|uniref:Cb0b002f-385d-45ab-a81f-dbceabd4699c n=1 Tax=Sclerotinia trifoliorum TaxID=28548 RepID=A0A8H2VPG4_9HELO|nr:cb0b002f-385d-45ab-a81f-dbceabd4699c [Sclerotinia trifoliorum]